MLTVIVALWTLSACHDDKKPHEETAARTVIIYISAENSISSFALDDINEIKRGAAGMQAGQHIVLYVDRDNTSAIYLLDRHSTVSTAPAYTFPTNQDSSDPRTLSTVLAWAAANAPASEYGIVFWSHADGWLLPYNTDYDTSAQAKRAGKHTNSFGIDDGNNRFHRDGGTNMAISDLARTLEESGMRFRFVYFDACVMQCLEVAYDLRHATDYLIASPMCTPADGAYYPHQITDGFFSDEPANIARTYMSDVSNVVSSTYQQGAVIAAVRTELMDSLAALTATLLKKNADNIPTYPDMTDVQAYCAYTSILYFKPDYFDASQAMRAMLPASDAERWQRLLDQVVVYKGGTRSFYAYASTNSGYFHLSDDFSGVSMFVPQRKYSENASFSLYGDLNNAFRKTAWYAAAGWDNL